VNAPAPVVQIVDRFGSPIRMSDTAHFAASRTARELRNWTPPLDSADGELLHEAGAIAARSYDLERNHGVAGGVIQTNVDNIVGTGLRLSAKPDYKALGRTKEWADDWARSTEAKWRTFANSPDFDASRELTFGGSTVLHLRTAMLSGDALALALWLPDRPGAKWATTFQSVDPARLCNPPARLSNAGLREGIEISLYGEPLAYWIRKSHPGDAYTGLGGDPGFERVEARTAFGRRRVLHLFDKKRAGQTRGKGILASVMGAFKMLDHYQRTELQTAVVNSMIAAFIETPLTGEQIADMFGTSEKLNASRASWDVKLEGAAVIPLHPGDKLSSFTPTRPNSAYSQFVETILRYISTGLHIPYELLMKDFSKTTYSSARAALLEAWRYFMSRRKWLAVGWANPVYELWLEEAVNRGEVEAPDFYENRQAYCSCEWIGPGRGWIDPMKEAQASNERLKSISTFERECAEQGLDWQEVLEQRATERAYAESLGLPEIHAAAPQGGGAPGAPGGPGRPAPGAPTPPAGQDDPDAEAEEVEDEAEEAE
jgi:lambda family phage portal protein